MPRRGLLGAGRWQGWRAQKGQSLFGEHTAASEPPAETWGGLSRHRVVSTAGVPWPGRCCPHPFQVPSRVGIGAATQMPGSKIQCKLYQRPTSRAQPEPQSSSHGTAEHRPVLPWPIHRSGQGKKGVMGDSPALGIWQTRWDGSQCKVERAQGRSLAWRLQQLRLADLWPSYLGIEQSLAALLSKPIANLGHLAGGPNAWDLGQSPGFR